MLAQTLLQIVSLLFNVIWWIILAQFIISMVLMFGNVRSEGLFAVYRSLNALLDPILRPIRKILPQTGALDLSPLVLLIGLQILMIILNNVVMHS